MTKKIFIILILPLFISNFSNAQENTIDKIVAIVGQKTIFKSEVEAEILQYKSRGETKGGNLKCYVFEELLYKALLVNQAKVDSLEVGDSRVEGELNRRLAIFEEQMEGRENMEKYFNKPYAAIKEYFRDIVKDQILADDMESNITAEVKITPEEVKKFYRNLPKDSLPLVESEIEIAQIVIHPKILDEQIEKIIKTLEGYAERVKNGEDFSFLASLYSDDAYSAQNDGDLGWVRRGDMVSEFSAAAFELEKEGELSDIIKTDFGYHLIQFIARKGERINIKHILKIPKPLTSEKMKAKAKLDSIADLIRSGEISFKDAAILYSTDEETSKSGGLLINPYTGTTSFLTSHLDPSTNYILKQMKIGEVSDPFESVNMKGKPEIKIIKLLDKTEPHIADIKTDYQRISDMALEKKKEEIVNEWIKKIQKTTYFKIDPEYRNCQFKYSGWVSTQ